MNVLKCSGYRDFFNPQNIQSNVQNIYIPNSLTYIYLSVSVLCTQGYISA